MSFVICVCIIIIVCLLQENVGGTIYFYPTANAQNNQPVGNSVVGVDNAHPAHPAHHGVVNAVAPLSAVPSQLMYAGHVYPGPASNVIAMQPKTQLESAFFMPDEMRTDILARNEISNLIMDATEAAQHALPLEVDNYHALYPLEPPAQAMHTKLTLPASTYRATHNSTGFKYCLRRLHGEGEIEIYNCHIQYLNGVLYTLQDFACSPQSV